MAELIASQAGLNIAAVQERLAILGRLAPVRAGNRQETERLFRDLLPHAPHLQNLGLVSPDGTIIASAVPPPPGSPLSLWDRDWLQRVVRWGDPVVGGFQVGRITGNPNVILAHPVLDDEGRVRSVVYAALDLVYANRAVTWAYPGVSLLWVIVGEQGLVLLDSRPESKSGKPLGLLPGMFRGETVVPGTRWHSIVEMPENLVTAHVRENFLHFGLPASLILFVAAGIGLWIAYNTWRPLRDLTAAVRRVGGGESAVQIPVQVGGEVGELATTFAATLDVVERRHRELSALVRSSQAISTLDLDQSLQAIMEQATIISGTNVVRLLLLEEDRKQLRCRVGVGLPMEEERNLVIPVGKSFSGQVVATGKPLAVPDTREDPRLSYPQHPTRYGLLSYLGLPVKVGDRVIGVLVLNTHAPRVYSEAEIAFLSAFADQAAIAIENARLHEAVQHHAADLEAKVRQRTVELEEALRVKVEFLGKMSHELRTPLNFVLGFSDLLQQGMGGPLTSKQFTYVDRIQKGGKQLLSLVDDVLDIAQVDAGKNRLQIEPVILGPLIQEVLGLVQVQVTQKRLKVATALDPWMPFIVADRFKLSQVLQNLVGNAVKFTAEDGSIRISTRQVAEESGHPRTREPETRKPGKIPALMPRSPDSQNQPTTDSLEISVEDTGIGIRRENLETIFGAFHQVDSSGTRAYGGAGLGLTLVRKLIDLHGGRVWAESAGPGEGSRFVVRLPRLKVPKVKRILLVEDEALIRIPMASALESAGFAVMDAVTGIDALAAVEAGGFDLLILDIVLPDLDGWEILRRIREAEDIRTHPVLVIAGLEDVSAEEALVRGADEFLTKPVSPRVLVDTVVRLLLQSGAESGIAGPREAGADLLPGNIGR
jgi:signal transduction histidine kinase/ActR/RegA family two-component response regulator/HAMP domain-containing protein